MSSSAHNSAQQTSVDSFLLQVADVVNTTLDLDTLLSRVAALVRKIIDYDIFAILLVNEKAQELRIRFQVGHAPEVAERFRIKVGEGITGLAAQKREPVLVNDVSKEPEYINSVSAVRSELAIPMITKNKVIGVIDIEAPQPNYFTEEHSRLLTVIASRVAIGIENARLYTRVANQAKSLLLLNEISRELTSILDLDQLLKRIGDLLTRVIDYQMFSILLIDAAGEKLQHRFSVRFRENIHLKHDIPLDRGLVGYAAGHNEAVLVADVKKDSRYIPTNPETRSELVVPLVYKGKVIGVLDLEHTRRGYFTEEHKRTLTTLAGQIAIAIENARLYEQIVRQERRLEQDLSLARELQHRLLPATLPKMHHAEVAAKFASARAIGGDMYDFVKYSGGALYAIAIGDVSGKGAPAAIYAALANGILRSHSEEEPGAAEMLSIINLSLSDRPIDAQYIAMVYAIWDDSARTLRLANSGLPRPIHCRKAKAHKIDVTGLPLGLFSTAEYDETTIRAEPGDVFLFFSDGILDARNRNGELFGGTRVEHMLQEHCGDSAQQIVDAIFNAVTAHAEGMEAFDDETIVALKVKTGKAKK
ncbi:MAG TPA: GAF domain-containing protein [Candidatus Koribacter sp.]|jgi:sigma-B regulation protein RsbU (phosphoserine phosphatase)